MKFTKAIKAFHRDEAGAAAIEYALLVALLALAIVGALTSLGTETSNSFDTFSSELQQAQTPD